MEAFLGNNIKFLQFHDILTFLSNVITEQHKWKFDILSYIDESKIPTETELLNYITIEQSEFSCSLEQVQYISRIIKSLSKEIQCRIFYKRNLMSLLNNKRPLEMLLKCLPKEGDIFSNPNHPLDYLKAPLGEIYQIIREFVGYEYAYHDRYERAMTMKRTSVLVVKKAA